MSENINPKHNPATTGLGILFMLISVVMYSIKYILPAFIVLKEEMPYEWYTPMIPLGLGLLLLFMTDNYFAEMFGLSKKIVEKVSGTDKKEDVK